MGIAVDRNNGYVYVGDTDNARIQKFVHPDAQRAKCGIQLCAHEIGNRKLCVTRTQQHGDALRKP